MTHNYDLRFARSIWFGQVVQCLLQLILWSFHQRIWFWSVSRAFSLWSPTQILIPTENAVLISKVAKRNRHKTWQLERRSIQFRTMIWERDFNVHMSLGRLAIVEDLKATHGLVRGTTARDELEWDLNRITIQTFREAFCWYKIRCFSLEQRLAAQRPTWYRLNISCIC